MAQILLAAVLLTGCTSQSGSIVSVNTPAPVPDFASSLPENVTVAKLEVLHLHPTRQCTSCTAVDDYANATVTTYFADELASGKIVFRQITAELEENLALVEQYGVSSSSLLLKAYTTDGGFYPEESVEVGYRTDDQQVWTI